MKHTIKPFGRSFGIIALLVVALVFSFAVLVSCETPAAGKDGEGPNVITIDKDGYWHVNGELQYDSEGNPFRAYMSFPEADGFKLSGDSGQLTQTYGNVRPIVVIPLDTYGMKPEDITVRYNGNLVAKKQYLGKQYQDAGTYYDGAEGYFVEPDFDTVSDSNTYEITIDVKGRNGYYFSESRLPLNATLTISKTSPVASDYSLVTAVDYTGSDIAAADILGPNRPNLPAVTEDVGDGTIDNLKFAKEGVSLPFDLPKDAGVYTLTFTTPANDYWKASTLTKRTFTIRQGIPVSAHYDFLLLTPSTGLTSVPPVDGQPAWDDVYGAILPMVADRKGGLVTSDATPGPARYIGVKPNPVWDSTDIPQLPGSYTVVYDVPLAPSGNWVAGTVSKEDAFVIKPPTRDSILNFKTWLTALTATAEGLYYKVVLNIDDLGGAFNAKPVDGTLPVGSVGYVILNYNNKGKNVWLDLSSATFIKIDDEAFDGCGNLVGVDLSDDLEEIGEEAFASTNIESVTIPDNVKIYEQAFNPCVNLTTVIFGGGVTFDRIDNKAFIGNLQAMYIADGSVASTYTRAPGTEAWVKQ